MPETTTKLIPYLTCRNASEAITFYEKAFGAVKLNEAKIPDGRIINAALNFGGAMLFLCDEFPERGGNSPLALGGTPGHIQMMVPDCDAVFAQAVEAGCTVAMPLADMFWGDRFGMVSDPYGHLWGIATTQRPPDAEEIQKALDSM